MDENEFKLGAQSDFSIFADTMVEMTWPEVQQSVEREDIVLFPIGVIEAHGPHLDLSPDVYMAYLFSKLLRQKLAAKGIGCIIAPPYYWGIAQDVRKYPGTFSVRPETFKAMLVDIFCSLDSWGFTKVFINNAHGDRLHVATIEAAIQEVRDKLKLQVYRLSKLDVEVVNPPVFPAAREGGFKPDYHAGANETAAMWTFYPQKVRFQVAKELKPQATFDPLAYCGDPASFELENTVLEYFEADLEMDALKIEAFLKNDQR
ncbi:MAG TPA: creatininase family protein [Bacillota bacterium]|nr:creatininase family protein [Bacillota bacterium]